MQVPGWSFLSYLDQSHMQNAMNQLASGANDFSAKRFTPGLVRSDVIGVSGSGTSINLSLPAPFGVLFNSGLFSTAHGTTAGQDTQSYSVNFTSLFPATGSLTGYVVASYTQCQQQPEVITGPPQGNPAYDPAFTPYTNYQTLRDSLALVASTGAPDNLTTFELARCTLNAGSGAVASITTAYQVTAGSQIALPYTPYSSNTVLSPSGMVGRTSIIAANGTVLTLPLSNTCVGLAFNFASSGVSGSIISQGADVINGLYGASGVTSMPVPVNGAGMLWSTGNAWVLLSDSNLLNVGLLGATQTWTGTNTFDNPVTVAIAASSGEAVNLGQFAAPIGASNATTGTSASVTTSTFTAPSNGNLFVRVENSSTGGLSGNGLTSSYGTASLAGLTQLTSVHNGLFDVDTYNLPMTAGQSTTLTSTATTASSVLIAVSVTAIFIPGG